MARRKAKMSVRERISSLWKTKTKKQAAARKQTAVTAVKVAAVMALLVSSSATHADISVGVGNSTAPWLGFMNVFNLPAGFSQSIRQFRTGFSRVAGLLRVGAAGR